MLYVTHLISWLHKDFLLQDAALDLKNKKYYAAVW